MKRRKIAKTDLDGAIEEIALGADQRTLATWAADCAVRVLPHFEEVSPDDTRPGDAITALRTWIKTGVFHMAEVRKASLAAHAAARSVEEHDSARSAARVLQARRWRLLMSPAMHLPRHSMLQPRCVIPHHRKMPKLPPSVNGNGSTSICEISSRGRYPDKSLYWSQSVNGNGSTSTCKISSRGRYPDERCCAGRRLTNSAGNCWVEISTQKPTGRIPMATCRNDDLLPVHGQTRNVCIRFPETRSLLEILSK